MSARRPGKRPTAMSAPRGRPIAAPAMAARERQLQREEDDPRELRVGPADEPEGHAEACKNFKHCAILPNPWNKLLDPRPVESPPCPPPPPPGSPSPRSPATCGWARARSTTSSRARGCRTRGRAASSSSTWPRWSAGSRNRRPARRRATGFPRRPSAAATIPLLDWAVRESRCGLALLTQGSGDGLERLARGEVSAALMHLPSADLSDFNRAEAEERLRGATSSWWNGRGASRGSWSRAATRRRSGRSADLAKRGVTVATRQAGAGSAVLLERLLDARGHRREAASRRRHHDGGERPRDGGEVRRGRRGAGRARRRRAAGARLRAPRWSSASTWASRARPGSSRPCARSSPSPGASASPSTPRSLAGYDISGLGAVTWNDPD